MKVLVAYFSAEGTTAKVAKAAAKHMDWDLFEIKPVEPYTKADIMWMNPVARCNKEKIGKKDVPIEGSVENFSEYDVILLGFPIWYMGAPNVVNTFCKSYDWTGKKIALFATSGGSGIGKSAEKLSTYVQGAEFISERLIKTPDDLKGWLKELKGLL